MRATLFGYELDIVDSWEVDEWPSVLRRPRQKRLSWTADAPLEPSYAVEVYEHHGGGIYRRVA